jgi:MoxR-like ATPase
MDLQEDNIPMQHVLSQTITQISQHIIGKEHQIKLALSCLLANGHLLIEDLPGMGKTSCHMHWPRC